VFASKLSNLLEQYLLTHHTDTVYTKKKRQILQMVQFLTSRFHSFHSGKNFFLMFTLQSSIWGLGKTSKFANRYFHLSILQQRNFLRTGLLEKVVIQGWRQNLKTILIEEI
jgi:hypothetical protein